MNQSVHTGLLLYCRGHGTSVRKNSGLLQLVLAVVQTLRHPSQAKLDTLLGIEKGLLQCLGDEKTVSPLGQLEETLKNELKISTSERFHNLLFML